MNQIGVKTATFDLWHDEKLMALLNERVKFYLCLDSYGTGIVDLPVHVLEMVVGMSDELKIDEETKQQFREDIASAETNRAEYVTYQCF